VTLIRDLFVRLETEREFDIAMRCHGARGEPSRSKYLVMDNASIHKGPAVTRRARGAQRRARVPPAVLAGAQPVRDRQSRARTRRSSRRGPRPQVRAGSLAAAAAEAARNARQGPGGGARTADQAVRSTWIRSHVLDRLVDVQPSNVAAFYRKCAWGNVVLDLRGIFF
jgi:hypothetical protein